MKFPFVLYLKTSEAIEIHSYDLINKLFIGGDLFLGISR